MLNQKNLLGYIYTFSGYAIWGILPIYWKWLSDVDSAEIIFHRILWTSIYLGIIVAIFYRNYLKKEITTNSKFKWIFLSAILLGMNWYLFIYAISINRILDASLGYYINPLVSVLLGVFFLKEKLPKIQIFSVLLAGVGVAVMTINYGRLPVISLVLALSFGSYGLVRKMINMKSIPAVFLEALIMLPVFAVYFWISGNGISESAIFNSDLTTVALLVFSGVVTFVPLILFGQGITMISLKSVGFLQYITPTMMLLIGTLLYNEPFSATSFVSFGFIWVALGIYTWSVFKK